MVTLSLRLTDGAGDDGYGVILKKASARWEDNSSSGHVLYELAQMGEIQTVDEGLSCNDGSVRVLLLRGADWNVERGARGPASHRSDPTNQFDNDWGWEAV